MVTAPLPPNVFAEERIFRGRATWRQAFFLAGALVPAVAVMARAPFPFAVRLWVAGFLLAAAYGLGYIRLYQGTLRPETYIALWWRWRRATKSYVFARRGGA